MIDLTKAATVFIGRRGEHHFRNIEFDVSSLLSDEYLGETLTAIYKRPDGTVYPVVTSYTTGVLTWSPSATDTITSGVGQLEIRVVLGDVVGKSVRVLTIVEEALADGIATPPEPPAQEWLNQVLSALAALNIDDVYSLLNLTYNLLNDNYTLLGTTHDLLSDSHTLLENTHADITAMRDTLYTRTGIILNHLHPVETASAPDMASRRASITFTGISAGNNMVLDSVTYMFVTVLGSPAANTVQVLIQSNLSSTVKKLAEAIRGVQDAANIAYGSGTNLHPTCTAYWTKQRFSVGDISIAPGESLFLLEKYEDTNAALTLTSTAASTINAFTRMPHLRYATGQNTDEEKPKLRVAAYCRVSTDSDEQATSYETQIEHYTSYINGHPDWTLAGIFADDGISGTNTKKREEFNHMIEECMAGNIDMVITKSISRFARNTLDCLKYIRQLKDKNIPVFFEKENINSMDSKGEVMLTIMASLAQQESQSLSQNVKLGLQYRYQQGEIQINCARFLGYTKDENKHLVIVPEEAEIVKRIYREYLEGASMLKIARGLEADGILNGAGKERWHTSNVNQILRNEKYIGDALLQKTYTVDFLTKKRVKNNGLAPQYYVENSHEAIIPREIFMQVQEELIRRRIVHTSPNGKNRTFSSTHCFSNMIICGACGEFYRRIHWNNRGKKSVVWRCISRLENTGLFCDARTVPESQIEQVLVTAINQTLCEKDSFLSVLKNNIEIVLSHGNDTTLSDIDKRLEELQTELLKLASSKADYEDVADEIYRLREEKQKAQLDNVGRDELKKRITDMGDFLQKQPTAIIEYDEPLVRRLIEKVTIYEDKFTVEFKSGVMVDVKE